MLFTGLFILCLIGCYIYATLFFSNVFLAIVVTALIMAGFLKTFVQQGDKIKELEKRLLMIETERTICDSGQENAETQEEL